MNKYAIAGFLVIILACVGLGIFLYQDNLGGVREEKPSVVEAAIPKTIRYSVEVSNPTNRLIENIPLYIAVPAESLRQKITKTVISELHEIQVDASGNRTAKIQIQSLVPYETKIIDVQVNLEISAGREDAAAERLEKYLQSEKFIESDNKKIKAKASSLSVGSSSEIARKTFEWVTEYLSDAGFVQEDRGALYAFENKTADCTEYMYLYGALLRANKIPARMVSGFVVDSNKKLKAMDYHNWVEVFLDDIWRVVDPQGKKFMEEESSYVVMRTINNSVSDFFDNSQQLVKVDGQALVKMN